MDAIEMRLWMILVLSIRLKRDESTINLHVRAFQIRIGNTGDFENFA